MATKPMWAHELDDAEAMIDRLKRRVNRLEALRSAYKTRYYEQRRDKLWAQAELAMAKKRIVELLKKETK